jgi:hypothetical protein
VGGAQRHGSGGTLDELAAFHGQGSFGMFGGQTLTTGRVVR